ncbi:hypothetical protein [Catenulispora rubra]|uniref:hypothetical protein n=1 Tax=Catenulispora rubra TaxID=280293 RepID=UPI00189241E2|nr:hypothetical protein [Catenulispora rubra]
MTEIEDTLTRALAAEADRHEPPVFDARRIAEGAVRRKLWRRPLFAVAAGAIAVAGGGGVAVFAAAAGHSSGGRVTVTFRNEAFVHSPIPLVDGDVARWLRQTAAARGLKDVNVFLSHSPVELVVQGRASDTPKLSALLGTPVVLQFPLVEYPSVPPNASCKVSTNNSWGAAWLACGRANSSVAVASAEVLDYHVVSAQAEPPATGAAPGSHGWRVAVRLDHPSADMLAGVARTNNGGKIAVMVDGMVHDQWDAAGLNPDGVLTINGSYTEQEARTLAARLSEQGPPVAGGTVVTVTRP